ncbi:PAS domain-containing hybrid sensor histidine kinase/response regulator [Desulfonatronovibrio hydrogenovorans]|uniref:PAS domain-containing hybrid sensor histidine kinase/response regulator n=1 Tax=Desulfonatronovibrio hydrogenovorans TaxID=53245 RepID=UPI00068D604C|nr:PAS domain-containing sensor histidine kinase [Desulfonatronovibrio hydrogenovorans]
MSRKSSSAPSDPERHGSPLEKLIGLGPKSMQKSYYPELKAKLDELTRFRTLLDNINDLIILIDVPTGLIIDVNKATASLLDFESAQILGEPLSRFMDHHEAEKISNFFKQKKICSQLIRTHLITRKHKTIPVEINCKIVRIKPNGYGVLIARNITDQEKARQEIELQRTLFRQLFDNSPKAIALCDEHFSAVDINKSFTHLFGYTISDLAGQDLDDFILPPDLNYEKQLISDSVSRGETISLETRRHTSTGQILDVEIICFPVSFGGQFQGLFTTFSDQTEKIRAEQDMARQQKLESISLLAGGIAHDFNNILSAILGNISLSRIQIAKNDSVQESLQRIENASIRAKDLTQQLLTFAKGGEPIKKTLNLGQLLKETVNFALSGSASKVSFSIAPGLNPIFADQGQISQVIQNLAMNADQAMPDGGVFKVDAKNIHLGPGNPFSLPPGNYVRLRFKDNGIGIRKQDLTKIFDPYFTTKQKGHGLGLAVVYSIIKKHGGYIQVDSAIGEGSEFTIILQASTEKPCTNKVELGQARAGARVLLMDDETDILEVTSEYLASMGYSVTSVQNGQEAIDAHLESVKKNHPFDVIVADLTIPGGMGGKQTVQKLKQIDPRLRAIVSSGYANDPVMSDYKAHGFSAGIVKPYRIEELDQLIQKCLSQKPDKDEEVE